jgi:hypothetical protein
MEGLTVCPRTALVQPILPASPNDQEGFKNDFRSFIGWYKLLESVRETFDVVTLREISLGAAHLDRYRYIVVPDCAYMQDEVVRQLGEYVQRGGRLMTAGRFAERNETGRVRPPSPQPLDRTVVPDHGRDYAGDPLRNTHAGNTPPLFLWRADTPATDAARRDGIAALRGFQAAIPLTAEFELVPDDASVGAVQYGGQNDNSRERAVYLVNGEREPVPAGRLTLKVPSAAETIEVYADTQRVDATISERTVALPAFRSSCIIKWIPLPGTSKN